MTCLDQIFFEPYYVPGMVYYSDNGRSKIFKSPNFTSSRSPQSEIEKNINKQLYSNRRNDVAEVLSEGYNDAEGKLD